MLSSKNLFIFICLPLLLLPVLAACNTIGAAAPRIGVAGQQTPAQMQQSLRDAIQHNPSQAHLDLALAHGLLTGDAALVADAMAGGADPFANLIRYDELYTALNQQADELIRREGGFIGQHGGFDIFNLHNATFGFGCTGRNCPGLPPLALARRYQSIESFAGDLRIPSSAVQSLVAAAAYHGDAELLAFYEQHGGQIAQALPSGNYPIHLAALRGNRDTTDWLLRNGASASTVNKPSRGHNGYYSNNITPLHLVAQTAHSPVSERRAVIDLLLAAGADINAAASVHHGASGTWRNYTPLHAAYAAEYNEQTMATPGQNPQSNQIARHLESKGADRTATLSTGYSPAQMAEAYTTLNQAMIDDAAHQLAAQERRRQESAINPSAIFAGAAAAGLVAYGMNQGGEAGMKAMEIGAAAAADMASGGGTAHLQQQMATAQQQQQTQSALQGSAASPAAPATQEEGHCFVPPVNCLTSTTRREGNHMNLTLTNVNCGGVVSVRACSQSDNPSFYRGSYCFDTHINPGQSHSHLMLDAHPSGATWWQLVGFSGPVTAVSAGRAAGCRDTVSDWGRYPNW